MKAICFSLPNFGGMNMLWNIRQLLPFLFLIMVISANGQAKFDKEKRTSLDFHKEKLSPDIKAEIPDIFSLMTDEDLAMKFPSYKKPYKMFTNPDRTADFGLNITAFQWPEKNLKVLKGIYKATYSTLFTEIEYMKDGEIREVRGNECLSYEFISKLKVSPDGRSNLVNVKQYNFLQYYIRDNKILIFNFTAPAAEKEIWSPVANRIMNSIRLPKMVKLPEYKPKDASRSAKP